MRLGVLICFTLCATLFLQVESFWGFDTHEIICALADKNLTRDASESVAKLIGNGGLESVATWADEVRGQSRYSWSAPYHYVNPKHDPLNSQCSFNYDRDCPYGDQCVVGAVFNYTNQLLGKKYSPSEEEALKFLAHFIPDMHNPMHVCGIYLGGNDFDVKFYGKTTNLHKVWDTDIPLRRVSELGGIDKYVAEIEDKISTKWSSKIKQWTTCSGTKSSICPDQWAATVEPYNCLNCWVGVSFGKDLRDEYYLNNYELVQMLTAMAAFRLAATVNEVFA